MISEKPLITKDNNTYYCRSLFRRSELLSDLLKEMTLAQEQIPGNTHCYGVFFVNSYNGKLCCKMPTVNGKFNYYSYYTLDEVWEFYQCR